MNLSVSVVRQDARRLSFPLRPAPTNARRALSQRLVVFAALHLVLLAAMYGAAVVNARGHELEANAYGAGNVEHMGRMTLHALPVRGAQP